MRTISQLSILLCLLACGKENSSDLQVAAAPHVQYFGFTLIDTFWDDPTDTEVKGNYADEVQGFCNLADILVVSPDDDIVQRTAVFTEYGMKAVLHLAPLFFEAVGSESPSGTDYDLRPDYVARWGGFVRVNRPVLDGNTIGAFYIGEEPTWNGISYEELKAVADLLESQFPGIPIMVIEASPALNDLKLPQTVDWVGFDHYFIKDPNTDPGFQEEWQTLRSKLSDTAQKLVVIMDCHYIAGAHGDYGNMVLDDMEAVALNYYRLAREDTDVIGILGYFWPNGFDRVGSIGARGMPEKVKDIYVRMGKAITGKD